MFIGQEILAYTNLLRNFKIIAKLEVFLKFRSRSVLLTSAPYRGNNSSTFLEDPLEKEMAIHYSTFTWKIPWMEEPGGLQSMGSQRVGHD